MNDNVEIEENVEIDRTLRSSETSEPQKARRPWEPPSLLKTPEPPPGMRYRWIRTEIRGQEDRKNVMQRFREGYVPVKPKEIPELDVPIIDYGKHAGVVGIGGLMLCKIDSSIAEERDNYFAKKTDNQMTAVDNDLMREEHPAMPITRNRQSRVTFGGGSKAKA
jgi:hypothetical protein